MCVLSTAACREALPDPTVTSIPSPAPTATATEVVPADNYVETEANGVRLGIDIPVGWKVYKPQRGQGGLMISEHYEAGQMMMGMQVHLFVYSISKFTIPPDDDNVALSVLNQISAQPDYVGGGTVSDPEGFDWDGHDAAYYLLNNGDGNVTMLVAVSIDNPPRLVVCNISSPDNRAEGIRVLLPHLFSSLTINGETMSLDAVNALPNPLIFPVYSPRPEWTMEPMGGS